MNDFKHILIVDDNEDLCENIGEIFELQGYDISTAYDGKSAIEEMKKKEFDLLLIDVKMPEMNGVDVFKTIREIQPNCVTIFMSAYTVEELLREALRLGAFGALNKPLDYDKLLSVVDYAKTDGARLLVVDDDKAFSENIRELLETEGYRVHVAYNSESALKKIQEAKFELIILDMKLAPQSGVQILKKLSTLRPKVSVVIVTGYKDDFDRNVSEGDNNKYCAVFEKPLQIDTFLDTVKKLLKQY